MNMHSLFRQRRIAIAAFALAACHHSSSADIQTARSAGSGAMLSPLAAHVDWWRAFANGDTTTLRAQSAPAVALTLSNGRNFDHSSMLAESQRFATLPHPTLEWSDTAVIRSSDGNIAVVAARLREVDPRGATYNRVVTVLERAPDASTGWRVLAAQGTHEPQRYARLPAAAAGDLNAYAGQYRVPNGIVRITVMDSALALMDPRGMITRLEPVGPGLFEAVPPLPATDVVQLLFTRDDTGRIITVSRLAAGRITTFPRVAGQ